MPLRPGVMGRHPARSAPQVWGSTLPNRREERKAGVPEIHGENALISELAGTSTGRSGCLGRKGESARRCGQLRDVGEGLSGVEGSGDRLGKVLHRGFLVVVQSYCSFFLITAQAYRLSEPARLWFQEPWRVQLAARSGRPPHRSDRSGMASEVPGSYRRCRRAASGERGARQLSAGFEDFPQPLRDVLRMGSCERDEERPRSKSRLTAVAHPRQLEA